MKVIHIIPSAFDYFDDIRSQAFKLLDAQTDSGLETEAFTLQYGVTTKSDRNVAAESAPSHEYKDTHNVGALIASLDKYDIVHLHTPFFGAAGSILKWKRHKTSRPLVVTYYRDQILSDLFSVFVRLYNTFYLPKIFFIADALICPSFDNFNKS